MKKQTKRLFLFAGYDKDGILDDTLLHYLTEISKLGDIVLFMDCDVADDSKLKSVKNLLHYELSRHSEYDFGSYKRGYMWAYDNKILSKYDWIYLVNDSVYGPLFNVEPLLRDLESRGADFIGMTDFFDKNTAKHIQSWFIGLSAHVATSKIIYDFMQNIKHCETKDEIILKYEVGLSRILLQNGFQMSAYFNHHKNDPHTVYQYPNTILEHMIPFIKKPALNRLPSLVYLLQYTSDELVYKIYNCAKRACPDVVLIKTQPQQKYEKYYRFTLLSIPIITVYRKIECCRDTVSYKAYIFDKIPVAKLLLSKCQNE